MKAAIGKSLEWSKQQRIRELFGIIECYEEYDYKRERTRERKIQGTTNNGAD